MTTFVKENFYASATSDGFSNTWQVLVFEDAESAQAYVEASERRGTAVIPRRDVPRWHGRSVRPFSGDYLGVIDWGRESVDGCLGTITAVPRGSGWPRLSEL